MLLCDAYEKDFEQAVVISNDSDLALPIETVRTRLSLPVGLLCPWNKPSFELQKVATFVRHLRTGPLSASHLPNSLTDAAGTFSKPATW